MSHSAPIADELYERIKAYAARHAQQPDGLIEAWLSDAVQQAIDASAGEPAASEVLNDSLFKVADIFAGNEPGWSKRHDELLAEQI